MVRSYLSNRTQSVSFSDEILGALPVEIGIPQGSNLGPTLFIIFINQLPENLVCKSIMYADDTTTLHMNKSVTDLRISSEMAQQSTKKWVTENGMLLNEQKTTSMIFSLRHMDEVHVCEPVRFLGVTLDSRLIWDKHVDMVCTKLNGSMFFIRSICDGYDSVSCSVHVPRGIWVVGVGSLGAPGQGN